MIELNIDGQTIQCKSGETVLEAALANGIDIPRLCYHPELSVSGGCRLCLVEVEGRPFPTASCGLLCEDGMSIQTQSDQLSEMRRDIIDLFVPTTPGLRHLRKGRACVLQNYAYEYGVTETIPRI